MGISLRFEELPGPLVVYDASGTLIDANQSAQDLLGASVQELVGSRAAEAGWFVTDSAGWPHAANMHPALAAAHTRQPQRGIVARVIRHDGGEVWIQVDAVPVIDATGTVSHVVATLADVSGILNEFRHPRSGYGGNALAEVTNQLASAPLDPEAILQTVTGTLSKLRSGTWVAALINKDPRTVRVVAANDDDPQVAAYIENMQLRADAPAFTVSSRVIETGEPVLIANVPYEEFTRMLNRDVREYLETNTPPPSSPIQHLGVLVVPMRARGAVVGTLGLFERRGSNPLSARDVEWLQEIADRTGLATENAQLYVDAVKRLERLTALRSVGRAMISSPDVRLTLHVILDQATAGLGVDAADILLVDANDGMLGLVASTGFQSTSIPDYRIPVDEGIPGGGITGRRIETVTAPGGFSQFRRRSLFAREGFKSYGAVPLIARDKLVGLLEVFHRTLLQPDQEWLEFLDALGNEATLAIDRADLIARVQHAGPESAHRPPLAAPDLTRVEREILRHVVDGLPNRLIAEKVHLSEHTIKFHVSKMLDKVGASNRTELAHRATQEGWIEH